MVHVRACMLAETYHSQVVRSRTKTVVAYKNTTGYRAKNNFRVSSNTWLIELYISDADNCVQWAKNRKTAWLCLPYCHQWLPAILDQFWWLLTKQHRNSNWQKSRIWNSLSCSDIMIDGASIYLNFSLVWAIGCCVGFITAVSVIEGNCYKCFICLHFTINHMGRHALAYWNQQILA